MATISVIIPIYNSQNHLAKCLDSITNQSLKDIEIICIDDFSNDKSVEILNNYAIKDKRIKIIKLEENKGASYARNIGIDNAQGEYISFIDSDDYIEKNFYELLYKKAKEENADISKGYYRYKNENKIILNINEKIKEEKSNFAFDFCSAIYKSTLIKNNHIYFPPLSDMEDPIFSFTCANKANKIITVKNAYVNIFTHSNSQTAKPVTSKRLKDKIKAYEILLQLADEFNISKNSYGYVLSNWLCALFYNIENLNIKDKLYLQKKIEFFMQKIKYKEAFLYFLKFNNEFIFDIISNKEYKSLIHIDKLIKINQLKREIKQLNNSIDILSNLCDKYAKKYASKEIIKKQYSNKLKIITVVNNYELYNKLFQNNEFIKNCKNIELIDINNVDKNEGISKLYNNFLKKYNFNNEAWLLFCHNDWQLLDDINSIIEKLDKNSLYGPIGAKFFIFKNKYHSAFIGHCIERERNGNKMYKTGELALEFEEVDTFDCQAMLVHSSLIENFNLKFDENLLWDLYIEDFCINSKIKHKIKSFATHIDCCHWSGYHKVPASYYDSLNYVNNKYPNILFSGTCSTIGGMKNIYQKAGYKEYMLHKMRQNIRRTRTK